MLISCLNDSNEGILGGEAEMRGFMVKCEERPLVGKVCETPVKPPMERWCYGNRGKHMGRYLVYA